MPRYVSSNAYVFRVNPISGAMCVVGIETASPYEMVNDGLSDELCPATRGAAAALRVEQSHGEQQQRGGSNATTHPTSRN
jgi:hypothetical protein